MSNIKEQLEKDFGEKFIPKVREIRALVYIEDAQNALKQWHINSLISLAKGEVERLKAKKYPKTIYALSKEMKKVVAIVNQSLDDSISHWEGVITSLTKE